MTLTPCPSLRASACIVINTCLASFWPFLPLHAQSPAARLDSLFASIEPTVKWTLPRGAAAGLSNIRAQANPTCSPMQPFDLGEPCLERSYGQHGLELRSQGVRCIGTTRNQGQTKCTSQENASG